MMITRLIRVVQFLPVRRCSSALYITGDKAHENFAVLTPHIDIVERFENRDLLEANIKARGKYVDLDGIAKRWAFFQDLMDKRYILEVTKQEISKEIARLLKEPETEANKEQITKLKTHATIVKDEFATLRKFMYGVEESAALKALSLPNILHEKTPVDAGITLVEHLQKPSVKLDFPSHVQIGHQQELLEVHDNSFAFLLDDAALFEQAIINYFHEKLSQAKIVQFSNADFAKSIIVEGCGSDFNNKTDVITLENGGGDHLITRLHLTGGASHYAFMAHFTKYLVPAQQFPLRFFAIGRKYQPVAKEDEASLFNLMQQSAVEIFYASRTNDEMNTMFEEVVNLIQNIYEGLGLHFKLTIVRANQLKDYESLRVAIEMFSNHINDYVEVGSVSILDAFLSKRLLFTYSENKERKFPKLIVGNVLNVQKVLACALENKWVDDKLENIISENLRPYVP